MLQQQEIDAMFPDEWCPTPAFSIEQASGKLRRIDTKTSMSNRTAKYEERVQLHTALRPAVCCKLAMLWPKMQATSGERRSSEQSASSMAAKTFQMHTVGSWSLKQIYAESLL